MPNRLICEVLDEMRKLNETRNFSALLGLIEEAQILANRMEAALGEQKDFLAWHKKVIEEKDRYTKLVEEANKLRKAKGEPEIEPSRHPNW